MTSPWRLAAQEAIWTALQNIPIGADAVKAIDAAYPFYERANHPYKIWLDERKKTLIQLGLYQPPKNRRKCKYHPDGQTCLICQGEQ